MWLEFKDKMEPFRVFSVRDIKKMFPGMNNMNLVRWHQKGYLVKIIKGWYCFPEYQPAENMLWLAANLIYAPSYISLHSALSYYNLIPEAVYSTTSVSPRRTNQYQTSIGNFDYRTVKKSAFGFGHRLIDSVPVESSRQIVIAELEKAILDFLYFNHQYISEQDFEALRFDRTVLNTIDNAKLFSYLDRFESNALNTRLFEMIKVYAIA
jgi:predicted transcriptional regulator of viral defense system